MAERIDRDELRALIREALKEALSAPAPPTSLATGEGDHAKHGGGGENKRSGRHSPPPPPPNSAVAGFGSHTRPSREHPTWLAVPLPRSAGEEQPARSGEYRLATGVLNESKIAELGRTHSKIIIGTDVAVTPLARDRAREIKVEIVRQKP